MTKKLTYSIVAIQLVFSLTHADYAKVIHTSKDAAQIRVDLLEQAQEQIDVSTLIFEQDTASLSYMALLRKKAIENKSRKFKVRVLIDYMFNSIKPAYMKVLLEAGIQLKEYHRPSILHPSYLFTRLHDKIILTDKKNIVIGGRNFSASYIQFAADKKNYVDRDVYVQSEVVGEKVQNYYDVLWDSKHSSEPKLGIYSDAMLNRRCERLQDKAHRAMCFDQQARANQEITAARQDLNIQVSRVEKYVNENPEPIIKLNTNTDWTNGAVQMDSDRISFYHHALKGVEQNLSITKKIKDLLLNAKQSVLIDSGYLILSKGAEKVFKTLAERDIYVRITTNSLASNDSIIPQAAYYSRKNHYLNNLELDVYEWKGPETIHSKSMIIDDKIAAIGTFNIEPRAEKLNREVMFVFDSEDMSKSLNESMNEYINNSRHIDKTGLPVGETEEFPDVSSKKIKLTKFLSKFIWILGPQL